MRVCFLALQAPHLSPSQRYRFEAFIPYLNQNGIEVDYQWLLSREDLRIFYGAASPLEKGGIAAKAAFRRLRSVLPRKNVDVFFVQREAFFLLGEWSEWLAHLQAPVVFDFDDSIWVHAISPANRRFAWLKNVTKIQRIVALSKTVIAGNEYLAAWARQNSSNVHVIPTCVDTEVFSPKPKPSDVGSVTVGWSGSASTVAHFQSLLPALERIKSRCGARVQFRMMGDPSFSHAPLGLKGEAWTPAAELEFLSAMDIGVMPLPDDEWTRGKCGLKGLVSMSMGAATVMSPVGVNTQIVTHGVHGLLASTQDEWVEALTQLIEDAPLRARLGKAGRARVVEEYSVNRWKSELAGLLMAAAR